MHRLSLPRLSPASPLANPNRNRPGHYDAKVWDDASKSYISKPDVGVFITVEETFDNNHRVVAQRGSGTGKFTFSAADSGEHRICVVPQNVQAGGGSWFGSEVHASVKFTLDMAIGETSKIESTDKGKIDDLAQKIRDLNSRLQDVRREQVFQRVGFFSPSFYGGRKDDGVLIGVQEREAEFRDQSEHTNSRVVRWTLIQLAVLGITCAWQLSHLRAFFIKQKLT